MTVRYKQLGFSAIELMITLFIAVSFFTAGYQIYSLITTDGNNTRSQARASNIVDDYMQRYKPVSTTSCAEGIPLDSQSVTVSSLINVTVTVTVTCPIVNGINVAKETVTVNYGIPQKSISNSIYVNTKPLPCPTGFIVVPGSPTYGTSDFCVMKYEAKADDNGDGIGDTNQTTGYNTWPADTYPISATRKLVSSAAGYPVANISQTTATTAASSANFVYGCASGCHIITEAEWMTIAQNVLSVPSNWSGGAVGGGYIYSGHNDSAPNTALVADASDANGYASTGQSSPSNQRRTLTLTNGEVIWDLAGNVWEWTAGQTNGSTAQQPGAVGNNYASWIEWPSVTTAGSLQINPFPSGTGLSGSGTWNSSNGIGPLISSTTDTALHGFIRSGRWNSGGNAGVLTLNIIDAPGNTYYHLGFRVSR